LVRGPQFENRCITGIHRRSEERGGRKVGAGKREKGGEKKRGERKCKEAKIK